MSDETPAVPARLGDCGRRLWAEVTAGPAGRQLGPLERALLLEACRIVDRLERLDRLLCGEGDDWIRLAEELEDRSEVAVVVDGALGEARQQAGRLTSVLAELRQRAAAGAGGTKVPAPPAAPGPGEVPSGVASILGRGRRAG